MPRQHSAVALLVGHPRDRQVMIATQHPALGWRSEVEELLAHARSLRTTDPREVAGLTSLAWQAALRVPDGADLQALALAEEGNARRLLGEWDRAENRFHRATQMLPGLSSETAILEVRLLEASLAIQREQWPRAREALEIASDLAQRRGDPLAEGRCLIKRSTVAKELGGWEGAVRLALQARTVLPPGHALRLMALHNLVTIHVDGGWYARALEIQAQIQPYYALGDDHMQALAAWARGRALQGLQECDSAADALEDACARLGTSSWWWDRAEAYTDLAEACLGAGRLERVAEVAVAVESAFRAVGLNRRARRARSLMRAATTMGVIAIDQARRLLRAYRAGR